MEKCAICGKLAHSINPFRMIQRSPLICSPECLQRALDEGGMTIDDGAGNKAVIAPGDAKVEIKEPKQSETVTIQFVWEKEQDHA